MGGRWGGVCTCVARHAGCSIPAGTLNTGERMAHCRAQPRDTASSAFRVVLAPFPNTDSIIVLMAGIRVLPPTISTLETEKS